MGVVGTHAGHPCRELNPHKEFRECRYMGVVGNYAGNHTGNGGNAGKCKESREHRKCRYMGVGGDKCGEM